MDNLAIKQQHSANFRYKKSKGQAVDFDSQVHVFLRDRVNASCGVSKQDKIPFARSENDDVMK